MAPIIRIIITSPVALLKSKLAGLCQNLITNVTVRVIGTMTHLTKVPIKTEMTKTVTITKLVRRSLFENRVPRDPQRSTHISRCNS